ncbi:hypothetical protein GH714_042471 [Hevea brasiliensis]|uniref:Galactinol--sucrose galactosyltransferase n=1 Tax=Hevea brasiliensis TaxID=3981 RepID=A0A6A6MKN7_HEVBR|nr:hypothetical protein GH714_042471 [Hevea brasiliensis]
MGFLMANCPYQFGTDEPRSWHATPIGKLSGIRFVSIFRFKVWWSTHWIGHNGKDAEVGTQMIILDRSDSGRPYVLLLPLFEGSFSSSLQAGVDDYVDICVESGPVGCANPAVKDGVKGLLEGGCPPKWVLIDDGAVHMHDDQDPISDVEGMDRTGTIMPNKSPRLKTFAVNYKFKDYESPKVPLDKGMGAFMEDLKEEFRTVEDAYVWHAFLGMVSEEYGGRVEVAKAYYKALSASIRNHFNGNGVIASMEQGNDFMLLGTEAISLGRVDWDMFQTTQPLAEFHAASRATSGDQFIDCPFQDPLRDGETMLKLWNLNKYTGILGLFNCQGGGWCCITRRNKGAPRFSKRVDCLTTPEDIEWENGMNSVPMEGVNSFAVYLFQKKKLKLMRQAAERLEFSSAHLVEERNPICSNWISKHDEFWWCNSIFRG